MLQSLIGIHSSSVLSRSALVATAITLSISRPGVADEWTDCRSTAVAVILPACSILIDEGRAVGKQLGEALRRRAGAYRVRSELEKALADINRGVEIDPNNPDMYMSRALVRIDLNLRPQPRILIR
jgi:hypothetical protein